MKMAAYQFPVGGDIARNLSAMVEAVTQAAAQGAELLIFPECALTGYPPRDVSSAQAVDFPRAEAAQARLQQLAEAHRLCILAGTITREEDAPRNAALLFAPGQPVQRYHKQALWGWDRDNFRPGDGPGVFRIGDWTVGVSICYEVRFPEYFRSLYRARTDLNLLLFYDVSDGPNPDRYDLIRGHIRTRAVENVTPVLCVNATAPYQTAPTALYDASGRELVALEPDKPGLLVYDLPRNAPDFGEQGRISLSNQLTSSRRRQP